MECVSQSNLESIPEYFAQKCFFVTGATGFMGKILIEKLLRSCPDIGNIYVLIRSKKDKKPQDRWNQVVESELFDLLKSINKTLLNKVIVIEGDVMELGLGLSEKDREELINNVSIVYHFAATVRFCETLKKAIIMNVRGTREICNLVLEIKKLSCFLHISTTYCQIGNKVLEEKLYPARGDPYKAIDVAEAMDGEVLKHIFAKYIESFPNTYTFTKCLSETLVKDMCEAKVPTIIFRPCIVTPTIIDPIPGYVDNLNGPLTVLIAMAKGLIRTMPSREDIESNYCPADAAIRGIIKATWNQSFIKNKDIAVYNCANTDIFKCSGADHLKLQEIMFTKEIWVKPLFEINIILSMSYFIIWMRLYWYQFLPACFVDAILKLIGREPMALKYLAKITAVSFSFHYFSRRNWNFANKKFISLDNDLSKEDKEHFGDCMHLFDNDTSFSVPFVSICKMFNEVDLHGYYKAAKRREYFYFIWNNVWRMIFAYAFYSYIFLPFYDTLVIYLTNL